MMLTRMKLAAAIVVVVVAVAATGGSIYRAHAQPPAPKVDKDLAKEVEELRREVARLKRRLGERDQLTRQQLEALETIGRGLKMLRASTVGDKERSLAVDGFEKAYRRLSDQFRGREDKGNIKNWGVPPIAGQGERISK